jgi:hypothetical protein
MNKKIIIFIIKSLKNAIYPLIAVALFFGVWAIFSSVKAKPYLYPSPAETLGIFFV